MGLLCIAIAAVLVSPVALLVLFVVYSRVVLSGNRKTFSALKNSNSNNKLIVGIFHPYCNDGGGGERVLWCCVKALQTKVPEVNIAIYYGDNAQPDEIITKAEARFGIKVTSNIVFVKLNKRYWVESSRYPRFTTLGQSLGSMVLGYEALSKLVPDIYLDTMGYSFTYPLFKLAGCKVGCYVHYPTVSTDMLTRVAERRIDYNNNQAITGSTVLSSGKLWYYKMFAMLYGFMGRRSDVAMVNSTWTKNNINRIWGVDADIVYPPCNTTDISTSIPIDTPRESIIISVAQFRAEKNHYLQLESLQHLLSICSEEKKKNLKLVLIGSSRNADDQSRIDFLKRAAKELKIEEHVEFKINLPFPELKVWLSKALIGIHTMWCEHFGIGIVELMAAGVIVVAHNSGGPRSDIVLPGTGYLAATKDEYAEAMNKILETNTEDLKEMRAKARTSINRFSDEMFEINFLKSFKKLI